MRILRLLGPFVGGFLFALGMAFSGMTDVQKVKGFLDVFGTWDFSLVFVLFTAIAVNLSIYYVIVKKLKKPFFEGSFSLPTRKDIDKNLILGAAIFGFGWGLGGMCPGPSLVSLVTLDPKVLVFVIFTSVGLVAAKKLKT
ncbi:YeeE/YedE family protein [Dolichospermum sp. ST_sed1]|nr:YeeE/YedE family protein [Dolichospermum sp. ST_sed1]